MKTKTVEKLIPVKSTTVEGFAQAFNEVAEKLAGISYEKIWNLNEGHCLYFVYSETIQEPETLEDEFILMNQEKYCGDCPYFNPDEDYVLGVCTHNKVHVKTRTGKLNASGKACNRLYEGLKKGELITDESWRME